MRSRFIVPFCLGLFFFQGEALGQADIEQWQESDFQRLRKVIERGEFLVFRSDTVLRTDEAPLRKDIVFVGCNGSVDGEIEGSVIALESELGLRSRAVIKGDVFLLRSRMFQSRQSTVEGQVSGTSSAEAYRIVIDNLEGGRGGRVPLHVKMTTNRMGGFNLEGYDRVDGFSVSWGFRLVDPDYSRLPLFEGKVITATTRQAIGFDSRIELPIGRRTHNLVGISARSRTDTNDRWRLSDLENALKAFTFGLDYRYYFRREGYEIYYRRDIARNSHVRLALGDEHYYSLNNLSPFTLFGDNFVANLPVASGTIRSLIIETVIDTRNDRYFTLSGFWISATGELAGGKLKGRHAFARYDLELKRWNTFHGSHHTVLWAKLTGSDVSLPFQRGYTLGNTLRSYGNFAWSGDRMLMAQLAYSYDMPGIPVLDYLFFNLSPEVIYETGIAFDKADPAMSYSDLRRDIGLGIAGRTLFGRVGVHLFMNLDGAGIEPQVRVTMDMNVFR